MPGFDFECPAGRKGTGNMKGLMLEALPADTVFLYGAEMDYPTAPCIRDALRDFAENGLYGFTLDDGAYRETIVDWFRTMRGAEITADSIVPTLGTVYALATAVRAFTAPGDGVIVLSPSYYRLDRTVERNGRQVVSCPLKETQGVYEIDFPALEAQFARPENRLMILVNPHNPTGKVFPIADLERIRALTERYDVSVFSDEIFAETSQPGCAVIPYAAVDPERGMTCCSLGKAFNFTGVSQANLIVPNEALRKRYLAQRDIDHYGSVDPFFYTALRAAYAPEGTHWLKAMNEHTRSNYELLKKGLAEHVPLVTLSPLEGTFVAWLDCRGLGLSDEALRRFMEQEARIVADPGRDYGAAGSGFYRWNLATPSDNIKRAVSRLEAACRKNGFGGINHG